MLSRFWKDQNGSATIEFVIWMPMFGFLLMLIADASLVFMANARMWDVARDTARRLALRMMTEEEAEEHAKSMLHGQSGAVEVIAEAGEEILVEIELPIEDATVFGPFSSLVPGNLNARVVMLREPL